jgi:hypothetical protein
MLISLIMLALSPIQPTAPFADYVLNVPIRIENSRISSATLSCDIMHIGTDPADRHGLGVPGGGQVPVPVTSGAFNGTVTVTVSVSAANALRYPPTHWSCFLNFRWRNPDGTEFNESFPSNRDRAIAYTRITGQEVSENTTEISGPLPSS